MNIEWYWIIAAALATVALGAFLWNLSRSAQFIGPQLPLRHRWGRAMNQLPSALAIGIKIAALCAAVILVTYGFWQIEFTRSTIIILGAMLLTLVICAPLWVIIIYYTAKFDRQLAFVPTGEIKFVKYGETLIKPIVNVPNTRYDREHDIIEEVRNGTRKMGWFRKKLAQHFPDFDQTKKGIFWVSIFYPIKQIHHWQFNWPKLESKTHKEGSKDALEGYIIIDRQEDVRSLFYEYAYPVLTDEIELKGNFSIRLLVRVILTVRRPLYLVGNLKGKFMAQLISEISGHLDNGVSKLKKTDGSEYGVDEFRHADKEALIDELLKPGMTLLDGSFVIKEASYISFSYNEKSQRMVDAITAKEIEEREGEALKMKRKKEADAEEEIGRQKRIRADADLYVKQKEAEADAFEMEAHLRAVGSHPMGGEIELAQIEKDRATAVANANTQAMRELSQFKGNVLQVGGGGGVMISADDDGRNNGKKGGSQ